MLEVKCISNSVKQLPKRIQKYAWSQDETGIADISVSKKYIIYGIRKYKNGYLVLVLTDEINSKLPWWMPSEFYEKFDIDLIPSSWREKTYGNILNRETITAPEAYFGHEIDIEDGTNAGYIAFEKMKQQL